MFDEHRKYAWSVKASDSSSMQKITITVGVIYASML